MNDNKSQVATNDGKLVTMESLSLPATRIYGFVQRYKEDYFEDHSLDWCLDQIVTRGMAEIERQVKTAKKAEQNRAAGKLLEEFNLSIPDAKKQLIELLRQQAERNKKSA
jgi:hypothetical protein